MVWTWWFGRIRSLNQRNRSTLEPCRRWHDLLFIERTIGYKWGSRCGAPSGFGERSSFSPKLFLLAFSKFYLILLVWFDSLRTSGLFFNCVRMGTPGLTSTKKGLMFLLKWLFWRHSDNIVLNGFCNRLRFFTSTLLRRSTPKITL